MTEVKKHVPMGYTKALKKIKKTPNASKKKPKRPGAPETQPEKSRQGLQEGPWGPMDPLDPGDFCAKYKLCFAIMQHPFGFPKTVLVFSFREGSTFLTERSFAE